MRIRTAVTTIALAVIPVAASAQSIVTMKSFQRLLAKLDVDALRQAQAEMDAVETQRLVQEMIAR